MPHKIEISGTAQQIANLLTIAASLDVEQIKVTEPLPDFVGVYTETETDGVWELDSIVTKRYMKEDPTWYQEMAESDDFLISHGTGKGFTQFINYDR